METHESRRPKVLVVEDHAQLARLTVELIRDVHCDVLGPACSIEDALRLAGEDRPDVALVDLSLPDGSGEALIRRLRAMGVFCAVVSGYARFDAPASCALADVPWLEKPLTHQQLQRLMSDFGREA